MPESVDDYLARHSPEEHARMVEAIRVKNPTVWVAEDTNGLLHELALAPSGPKDTLCGAIPTTPRRMESRSRVGCVDCVNGSRCDAPAEGGATCVLPALHDGDHQDEMES